MAEAPGTHDPTFLPPDIPAPQDDGAARHLTGMKLPDIALAGDQRPRGESVEAEGSHRRVHLPAHRSAGCRSAGRAGTPFPARAVARRNRVVSAIISPI